MVTPPPGYFKRMWEVAKENGILFIADEVVTTFGRLGHWFASYDVFGVEPDIIVSAKGLTSGYLPLGATIFSDAVYERHQPARAGRLVCPWLYLFRGIPYAVRWD